MKDIKLKGDFIVTNNILIKENNLKNNTNDIIYKNTPSNFYTSSIIEYDNIKLNIILKKIEIIEKKTLFHFDKNHTHNFPKNLKNCIIKFSWPIIEKTLSNKILIKNPRSYLDTNIESGYSVKSFPSTYNAIYSFGPQSGRSQTTPMIAN